MVLLACARVSYEVYLVCICTSQVLCDASDSDTDMPAALASAPSYQGGFHVIEP